MALFWGEGTQTPLVGSTVAQAMRRRLGELGGVALVALGLGLALALASYDPADPSHFSATPQPPVNWLGRGGAIVADPLMRLIGLGAWGFVLVLAVWGVRMVAHLGEERVWGRLPLVPLALVLGTVFASTHAAYQGWPLATGLGGMLGDNGVLALMGLIPLAPDLAIKLLGLGLGALVLGVGGAALGLTGREARGILAWLGRSLIEVAGVVGAHGWAGARAGARAGAQALAHARPAPRPRSERLGRAEPTGAWRAKLPDWRGMLRAAPAPDLPLSRLALSDDAPRPTPRRREPNVTAPTPAADDNTALSAAIRALKASGDLAPDPVAPEPLPLGDTDTADPPPPPRAAVAHAEARPKLSRQAQREREPELFEEDPAPDAPLYDAPPLSLLQRAIPVIRPQSPDLAFEENARMLETVLEDYGVRGEITAVKPGPVVTLYELEPAPGLKASRIIGLADDIARSMSALSARVCTVPGRSVIGIELPNAVREKVLLRELFETAAYGDSTVPLALALGKDIAGQPVIANLAKMPHLLIAGTTGSGKSVAINTMILSLLYRLSPQQCRLIMIDPKMLELSVYDNIPHLLAPVVTDPKKAVVALKWVVAEMEERYRKMSKVGVRNLDGYNARVRDAQGRGEAFTRVIQTGFDDTTGAPIYETETFEPEPLPFIVVIVDEMADLMMVAGKEIEACIQRLAQMARASGIHLIMATQRPSVDVITGTIKANFPTRISFQVTSKIDSRTILQEQGAEQLLGMGDMLHMAGGGRITRVHGPFVSDEEVEEVVRHLKTLGAPDYIGAVTDGGEDEAMAFDDRAGGDSDEELYDRAVAIVARDRKCSTSYIQRKLAIGYNKAARLVEQMEDQGVVSPANAVGKREILVEER